MAIAPPASSAAIQYFLAGRDGCVAAAIRPSAVIAATKAVGSHHKPVASQVIRPLRGGQSSSGTFASSSSSHTAACESDGARQSPRGDNEPPEEIFGPFGKAERLNWLCSKKRRRNTRSQALISAS